MVLKFLRMLGVEARSEAAAEEWAEVHPGIVVVAAAGRVRIHRPAPWDADDSFLRPMLGPGRPPTTGALLRGACYAAAEGRHLPATVPRTLPHYIYRLAGAWQTTRVTPPTLRALAWRFEGEGRPELAAYCREKAQEETGHDRLVLRDLAALGLSAEAVVEALRPASSLALARYHEEAARSDRPWRCFGYAFCLEWLASLRQEEDLQAVRRILPEGCDATRCFRVHSGAGSDRGHVRELVDLVAGLPAHERAEAAIGAFDTAEILVDHAGSEPSDQAIEQILRSLLPGAPIPNSDLSS
jgi:Iron-containing redox enzyme